VAVSTNLVMLILPCCGCAIWDFLRQRAELEFLASCLYLHLRSLHVPWILFTFATFSLIWEADQGVFVTAWKQQLLCGQVTVHVCCRIDR
jgi:hypothetical protein